MLRDSKKADDSKWVAPALFDTWLPDRLGRDGAVDEAGEQQHGGRRRGKLSSNPSSVIGRRGSRTPSGSWLRGWSSGGGGALVLGWPLNMDGSEGPRCQAVRAFAETLDAALGLPILLWDERLTTFAAEDAAERAGLRGRKRAEMLDALAAAALLQDLLNTLTQDRS
jgi:putative holliday junction resolvase